MWETSTSEDRGNFAPVVARPWRVNGRRGYDLLVTSSLATIGDYLAALKEVEGFEVYRHLRPGGGCEGCPNCCRDRLPLTLADAFLLREGIKSLTGRELTLEELLLRYCRVLKVGSTWDITLKTDAEGYCIFLVPGTNRCRIYPFRPFVCRTYYCCPATYRSQALRSAIVNRGQDELAFYWERKKLVVPTVRLKDLCSPRLWEMLTGGRHTCA